ncbi:MAG: hypothetical protein V3R27_02220 [Pseudomonadales bacterium]
MVKPLECWNCGAPLDDIPRPISRHATCGACFEELHCCRACRHFRPGITGECDEDRADPPVKKEVANFCDWYAPKSGAYQHSTGDRRDDAKDKLHALFDAESDDGHGDEPIGPDVQEREPTKEDEARAKLDSLFDGTDKV